MTIEELKKAPEGTVLEFRGKKYYHLGWSNLSDMIGTALCTKEQFQGLAESSAHIYPDGSINRHRKIIGNIEEVTIANN